MDLQAAEVRLPKGEFDHDIVVNPWQFQHFLASYYILEELHYEGAGVARRRPFAPLR
jgi:hypothetical protein